MDFSPAVVLDHGSGAIKAGFAGEEKPHIVVGNVVGRPRHVRLMAGGALEGRGEVVGDAWEHRGVLRLNNVVENGVVRDWGDLERVWGHVLGEGRVGRDGVEGEDWFEHVGRGTAGLDVLRGFNRPLMVTEAPLTADSQTEKLAELAFEKFGCPALAMVPTPPLVLYAVGRSTGAVLEVGHSVTSAMSVYEGFAVGGSAVRGGAAGVDVCRRMSDLLRLSGVVLSTASEQFMLAQECARLGFVALDPRKAEQRAREGSIPESELRLPDGNLVRIGAATFRSTEVLFRPSLGGIEGPGAHEALAASVLAADPAVRSHLWAGLVLSGGTSQTKGFSARLVRQLGNTAAPGTKIGLRAPTNRWTLPWIGGSILASLSSFKSLWVSKEDYEERGASIVVSASTRMGARPVLSHDESATRRTPLPEPPKH